MKLLTVAFVWLLTKTCTGHQGDDGGGGGSLCQKLHFVGQFTPWKLEFCWVNISESRLTVKNLFTWSIAKYHRSIKMLSIFLLIFPHLQCISIKFPLPLTTCQITEAAYDGQKHTFPYRAWKWYSVRYSYYLSSRYCILVTQCSRHKRWTDFIILLSAI